MSSVRLSVTVDDCIVCRTFMKIGTVFRNKFSNNCESWVFNAVTAPLTSKAYNNCEVFFFTVYYSIWAKWRAGYLHMTLSTFHEFHDSRRNEGHIFLTGVNKRPDTTCVLLHLVQHL